VEYCGWVVLGDLDADGVNRFLANTTAQQGLRR
jgi:hypothetical protein